MGKTYTGSEKMMQLHGRINLVVCQKSKIDDWVKHFRENYPFRVTDVPAIIVHDLTNKTSFEKFVSYAKSIDELCQMIGVINYDLIFRRPELLTLSIDTLMLDESSIIQNETSKRSKFILKLTPKNVILLSGTPTGGKYEMLWSQAKLLGWDLSKDLFYRQYVDYEWVEEDGFWRQRIIGYKNTDRMIRKFKERGAHFLKTEEVIDLPEQTFIRLTSPVSPDYRKFRKNRIIEIDGHELVGDTILTAMLYERQLCGQYNKAKLDAFRDLVESTGDRLIVFYNFTAEFEKMRSIVDELHRKYSQVNGQCKDLTCYEKFGDSITFVQYQAGAMGLNLQLANKIIYFTPPLSSELYEQSKKRIHRIGQQMPCFYYNLICKGSIEEHIYDTLAMRKDYTDRLFEKQTK